MLGSVTLQSTFVSILLPLNPNKPQKNEAEHSPGMDELRSRLVAARVEALSHSSQACLVWLHCRTPLYPSFFPSAQTNSQKNEAAHPPGVNEASSQDQQMVASTSGRETMGPPKVRFADIGCGFGGLLIRYVTVLAVAFCGWVHWMRNVKFGLLAQLRTRDNYATACDINLHLKCERSMC